MQMSAMKEFVFIEQCVFYATFLFELKHQSLPSNLDGF